MLELSRSFKLKALYLFVSWEMSSLIALIIDLFLSFKKIFLFCILKHLYWYSIHHTFYCILFLFYPLFLFTFWGFLNFVDHFLCRILFNLAFSSSCCCFASFQFLIHILKRSVNAHTFTFPLLYISYSHYLTEVLILLRA